MEYRRLGKTGLKVSELSFGSWVTFHNQVDVSLAKNLLGKAYDSGVNFFDNAEVYAEGQSEKIMGQAIEELGWSRDSYIVSSKVFWGGKKPTQNGLSRKHVRDACDAALRRLRVDYLDLYFCHRPDPETPIEETVRAMHELVVQGKVLYWGTSEWASDQIFAAHGIARELGLTPPSMEQPQYNLFHRERFEVEYSRVFSDLGYGSTTWSPLASGLLSGKYNDQIPSGSRMTLKGYEWLRGQLDTPKGQERLVKVRKLQELSREVDMSMAALAIAWCLKNQNVSTVILGATSLQQLEQNLQASNLLSRLTPEMCIRIENIMKTNPRNAAEE